MSRKIVVRDYMARRLVTLRPDDEILRAVHVLIDNQIAGAPVVDVDGNLIGMLTEKDCMKVMVDATYHSQLGGLVAEFMTTEVEVMQSDDSIVAAAERFLKHRYHRYPVVENDRLVGQISRADVMRALGDYWQ